MVADYVTSGDAKFTSSKISWNHRTLTFTARTPWPDNDHAAYTATYTPDSAMKGTSERCWSASDGLRLAVQSEAHKDAGSPKGREGGP